MAWYDSVLSIAIESNHGHNAADLADMGEAYLIQFEDGLFSRNTQPFDELYYALRI